MGSNLPINSNVIIEAVTTSAGAANGITLVSTQLGNGDGFYIGGTVYIVSSTTTAINGQQREIIAYINQGGQGIVVLNSPFGAQVPINTDFQIISNRVVDIGSPLVSAYGYATTGGTTTSLTDANRTEGDNYWNGMVLVFTSGANYGLSSVVNKWLGSPTFLFTFSTILPNAVTANDTYVLCPITSSSNSGGGSVTYPITTYTTGSPFSLPNDTSNHVIFTLTPAASQVWRLDWVEVSLQNLVQNATVQFQKLTDGSNWETYSTVNYQVVSGGDTGVFQSGPIIIDNTSQYRVQIASVVAQGAAKNIPFRAYYTRLI